MSDAEFRADFVRRLGDVVRPECVEPWMTRPNLALEGRTPDQVIRDGDRDRLEVMLYFLESGQPG